ncbi:Hypothetical protein CINCED_3A021521 [Cinara cedri]|uniref:Uncharacterized protein n=1 Tax=Cinara cedri TaxID=506608 RepID=A0A5E4MBP4_9HEMI|nr:Hypothetical protein CINCED_3A021521 [Cinara cedri]
MAGQPPHTTINCPVLKISSPVTCQSPIVSPRTHQYVVQQPTSRTTVPQLASTNSVRHIIPSSIAQSSNVTYMLPSGAHIVRMNNVMTTTVAGDQRPNAQIIRTSSSQKTSSKNSNLTISEVVNSPSGSEISRTLGVTPPVFQKPGVNKSKLAAAAYYSQFKGNDSPPKLSIITKPNEPKPGPSIILTSNDWSNNKNVSISNLQKNPNYMPIPLIQKSGTLIKPNVDIQQQKPQHQSIRSVILPSNYRTNTVNSQQGTDCKLLLSSLNLPTQVANSNDKPNISNTPVSNIQQLNTNIIQIPQMAQKAQKPGANVHVGQLPQTSIRSVILPANYRPATTNVGTPRLPRGVDYRLILKPVLKNVPPSRFPIRQNTPLRKVTPQQIPPNVRSLNRPPTSKTQNDTIADSKIKQIPLKERKHKLVISEKSIHICIDEHNGNLKANQPNLKLTPSAIKLIQAEVTYRLFYLLRECKKYHMRCRTNVLSEESVRIVCSEYFGTFYGNKLWPLFCLKPRDDGDSSNPDKDENPIWMRKHNNVNLLGWIKHPQFYISYYRRRSINYPAKKNLTSDSLMNVSETIYEHSHPKLFTEGSTDSPKVFYQP